MQRRPGPGAELGGAGPVAGGGGAGRGGQRAQVERCLLAGESRVAAMEALLVRGREGGGPGRGAGWERGGPFL